MKYQCLWCSAIKDTDVVLKTMDDLDLKLGPMGCCAPDGDGHIWIPIEAATESKEIQNG